MNDETCPKCGAHFPASRAWASQSLITLAVAPGWQDLAARVKCPTCSTVFPFSTLKQAEIFYDLIDCATSHFENTGRYLQIWGELGEIYAEIKFGLRRHATHEAGSDGTIAGKLVEVKTISPEKTSDCVLVKSQGDFEQLLIVRIDRDLEFKGKLFDRTELQGASGKKFLRGRLK